MNHSYSAGATPTRTSTTPPSEPLFRIETKVTRSDDICRDTAQVLARRQRRRLVPGPLRVRPARARQPQHPGRSAQGRDEGHPQQPREAPPAVPPVRADRARRAAPRRSSRATRTSPFMLIAKNVRPEWRDKIPAIVHVDGTARVQTVRRRPTSASTGCSRSSTPSPACPCSSTRPSTSRASRSSRRRDDAACCPPTGIDYLALHDLLISKNFLLQESLSPIAKFCSEHQHASCRSHKAGGVRRYGRRHRRLEPADDVEELLRCDSPFQVPNRLGLFAAGYSPQRAGRSALAGRRARSHRPGGRPPARPLPLPRHSPN